jgi:hypothetical protein
LQLGYEAKLYPVFPIFRVWREVGLEVTQKVRPKVDVHCDYAAGEIRERMAHGEDIVGLKLYERPTRHLPSYLLVGRSSSQRLPVGHLVGGKTRQPKLLSNRSHHSADLIHTFGRIFASGRAHSPEVGTDPNPLPFDGKRHERQSAVVGELSSLGSTKSAWNEGD